MKIILSFVLIFFFSLCLNAREIGQTEITTEDGIEVFQDKKYYLLKKNVNIESDKFILTADEVKINFGKNLYDITELNAKGEVNFYSQESKIRGRGNFLDFEVKNEKLKVNGNNSELFTKDLKMFSDGMIEISNSIGKFSIKGLNSKLISENILIRGSNINGTFIDISDKKEITFLEVLDESISYIKNNDTEMYAKKINYNSNDSIIELIDNVSIIRNGEKITGDYGTLDTKNDSYKIKSNNQSKVKVIIENNEQ